MNYIDYLNLQIIFFRGGFIGLIFIYTIGCYFGWRQPIVLTPDYVVKMIGFSLIFIFIFPLINKWLISPLKK